MHVGATTEGRPRPEAIDQFKCCTFNSGEATEGLPYMPINNLAIAMIESLISGLQSLFLCYDNSALGLC
jgi:hypothetical protein